MVFILYGMTLLFVKIYILKENLLLFINYFSGRILGK